MNEKIILPEKSIAEFAPEKIEVLVFDVDDTVTRDTLGIKVRVWEQLFADQLEKLQEARELYEFTGQGDRYNMIAHIIGEPQEDCRENERVQEWAEQFETETLRKIREQGIHPDDLAALVELRAGFSGPIYLLSATPQASVEGNIAYFTEQYPELIGMFSQIIGTPMAGGKAGELALLADRHGVTADAVLMVGDGGSDYKGAKGAGTQFVAIVPPGKSDKWPEKVFPKLDALAKLSQLLTK